MSKQNVTTKLPDEEPPERAAVYVRMSTENQKYSVANQLSSIGVYATARGFKITKIYEDDAKSGLTFNERAALKQLFDDISNGQVGFSQVLVYDVSRWGRFQDIDESAYYEHLCRRQGVAVIYCAEQFENDGSLIAAMWKSFKRGMAAEFSRELSVKMHAALCEMARRGYFTGGSCIYGLDRIAVDERGVPRGRLARGHRKAVRSDHIVLGPGAKRQIKVVRNIFRLYANEGWSFERIARHLHASNVPTLRGGQWHAGTVGRMIRNEKYVGVASFNRVSLKLKGKRHKNDPALWIRTPGAFEVAIDPELFNRAQMVRKKRKERRSDEQMLRDLRRFIKADSVAPPKGAFVNGAPE